MSDAKLAELFRRALTEGHYSLHGLRLEINGALALTDEEFDLVWDELNAIDGDEGTVRIP